MTSSSDSHRDTPQKLGLDLKAQRLTIAWHDGHESVFGLDYTVGQRGPRAEVHLSLSPMLPHEP